MLPLSLSIVKTVGVVCVFVSVAFYTLLERKILGYAQIRKGAAKPRVAGILVPFADAIKLILKQSTLVTTASSLYWLAGGAIVVRTRAIDTSRARERRTERACSHIHPWIVTASGIIIFSRGELKPRNQIVQGKYFWTYSELYPVNISSYASRTDFRPP